jgi:hypothetical protein
MIKNCQAWSNKINLSDGRHLNFHEIFDEIDFDYTELELHENFEKKNYRLPQPISVIGEDGDEIVTDVFYNGLINVRTVEFEDGSVYQFTDKHQLKLYTARSRITDFIEVRHLRDGDDILYIKHIFDMHGNVKETVEDFLRVVKVYDELDLVQTWDVITPSGTYLLPNNCVSK